MHTFVNNMKTVLLLGGLTGLMVFAGAMLGQQFIIPFLLISVAMNFGAWFFSDRIAIATMRGQEVGPGTELHEAVRVLAERAGMPMPKVYVCPQEAPNAFATGRSPRHAAVAVTHGALRMLSPRELEGVLAHELAHIKNRDTLTSTIAATVAGVLATVAQWGMLLGGHNREGANPLVAMVGLLIAAVGAAVIQAMISRSREFVADADGAAIAGSPDGLISALAKLEALNQRIPTDNPNPAQNNLFIVEPLTGSSLLRIFATHPPTEQRIAALRKVR